MLNRLLEYRTLIADCLRQFETKKAKGDSVRLQQIQNATDSELLVKWLWLTSIVGGLTCFVIIPLILCALSIFIWSPIRALLWLVAYSLMTVMFVIFLLAIYFTTSKHDA